MNVSKSGIAASVLLGFLWTSSPGNAASPVKLSGTLAGAVSDGMGVPQMGATILLFNRYDRLIERIITGASGEFLVNNLPPDTYSLRVTLASFMPAIKRNIAIQPGMKSILSINLASVLSSIQVVSTAPLSGAMMSDEWKWVLRSSMTTRPVLRMLPSLDERRPGESSTGSTIFSDTRGLLKVSSGESTPFSFVNNQPDLGTSFALATSIYGNTHVQFSGNIGYGLNATMPAAGFRTTVSRSDLTGPVVKLTVQQLSLPMRGGLGLLGGQSDNVPAMRTLSLTVMDKAEITDNLELEYGAALDSVSFLQRLNYISPFARLTYHLNEDSSLGFSYSSGAPPVELYEDSKDPDSNLQRDLAALSMYPRVSMREGSAYVQRTQAMEIGYRIKDGSRTYGIGAYQESVVNGALTLSAPSGMYAGSGDLLPELSSNSSVFNIGNYSRRGFMASVTQDVREDLAVTLAYGDGGSLRADGRMLTTDNPDELRSLIHRAQHQWVMGKVTGKIPGTGTQFTTSYLWTDYRSLTPGFVYMVQRLYPEAGLNVRIRQPLPHFCGLPGRIEATAELRNMLAQGYLPISTADGQRMILTNSPRAVRGGVSFTF
jgi:hypothetical protein